MTFAQRVWLVASLIVIGAALMLTALEWDARVGGWGLTIYQTSTSEIEDYKGALNNARKQNAPAADIFQLASEVERLRGLPKRQHGFFVRREWGADALVWGGLFPLCLFAAAGFIAFGKRRATQ